MQLPRRSIFYLHRQLLLEALALAEPYFAGDLLDIACLDQPYRRFFGSRVAHWWGCDLPTYVGWATSAHVYARIEALPFLAQSFNTVLCTETLYMLPKPSLVFEEAERLLKPGGHVIVSAPQQQARGPHHSDYFRFSRDGLEYMACQARLEPVASYEVGGAVAMLAFNILLHAGPLRGANGLAATLSVLCQEVALRADRRWRQTSNAMGWVVVARKPNSVSAPRTRSII